MSKLSKTAVNYNLTKLDRSFYVFSSLSYYLNTYHVFHDMCIYAVNRISYSVLTNFFHRFSGRNFDTFYCYFYPNFLWKCNKLIMVLTADITLPEESELTVPEVNLSMSTLIASSSHLGKYCEQVNNVSKFKTEYF